MSGTADEVELDWQAWSELESGRLELLDELRVRFAEAGQRVVLGDVVPLEGFFGLRIRCEESRGEERRGVRLAAQGRLEIDGRRAWSFAVVWLEPERPAVEVVVRSTEPEVRLEVVREGQVVVEPLIGSESGVMAVEECDGGWRYRWFAEPGATEEPDLVFRVERVRRRGFGSVGGSRRRW